MGNIDIVNPEDLRISWKLKGMFTYNGAIYYKGINELSAVKILKAIYGSDWKLKE